MAFRLPRAMFSSTVRATSRPALQLGRRHMSASESAHGSQHSSGSDKPWIIGSALLFGPFFLYLLSPSARKKHGQHAIHHDEHGSAVHESQHESPAPHVETKMKDDEGTEVNVTDSLAASEHEDVPNVGENEFNTPDGSSSPSIENVKDSSEREAKSAQPEEDAIASTDAAEETRDKKEDEEKQKDEKAGEA